MAQIDLKNAYFRIKDGYNGPGGTPLVNNAAGYAQGATTMVVDGFDGAVAVNDYFKVAGSTSLHKITAHSETTGDTTSITFTPGLSGPVVDDAAITMQPHQLEIKLGEGTFSWTEAREVEYTLDRGRLSTLRLGNEVPVDVSFDFIWEFLRASTGNIPTIEDALKKRGNASDWVSTSADLCEPYAVDLEIEYIPPCGGEEREEILLADFRWESLEHNATDGTVSCSGKCNITEAITVRAA